MKSLKKLASVLASIMLGASLMAMPATIAYADEVSGVAAAADSVGQTSDSSTESISGAIESNDATDGVSNGANTASSIVVDAGIQQRIASGERVIDESGLLFSDDITQLNIQAKAVEQSRSVAPFYVTVDSLQGYPNAAAFADDYAVAYGMDKLAAKGCVVFLVCLNEGKYTLVSLGDVADTLDDSALGYLDTDLFPYLGRSDWRGAAETFIGDIGQTMAGSKANATSDVQYNGTYVTDVYGLFSDAQRVALEARATELAQTYNMGVYLLVVDKMNGLDNPSSAQRTNFATSFYRANDLGLGSGKDGIMLVIAVESRDYVTIAYGQGSYSFSDEGVAAMEDAVTDELGSNNWYGGCEAYYDKIGDQLEYYSVRGEPWTEPDPLSFLLKILAILGIPAITAFSKVKSEEAAMFTAREKTEASNYFVPGSLTLTQSSDTFSHTTHTVVPLPKHDDNDSGGSSFGGGGWGGGGGGGFSSSGGGKF